MLLSLILILLVCIYKALSDYSIKLLLYIREYAFRSYNNIGYITSTAKTSVMSINVSV